MEEYCFIAFQNTNSAMYAEDYLKKNNFSITMIPTPREVSESCGLSIKIRPDSVDSVKDLIERGIIKSKGIYFIKSEDGIRKVQNL